MGEILYRESQNHDEEGALLLVVVPVERCEHGNYARHTIIVERLDDRYENVIIRSCPGAGIGGDDGQEESA